MLQATGVPFYKWLPQRRWTLYMLISLFLWQNPLLVATQLMRDVSNSIRLATAIVQGVRCAPLPSAPQCAVRALLIPEMIVPPLCLCLDLLRSIAGLFMLWLMFMDSFKYSPKELPCTFVVLKAILGILLAASVTGIEVPADSSQHCR